MKELLAHVVHCFLKCSRVEPVSLFLDRLPTLSPKTYTPDPACFLTAQLFPPLCHCSCMLSPWILPPLSYPSFWFRDERVLWHWASPWPADQRLSPSFSSSGEDLWPTECQTPFSKCIFKKIVIFVHSGSECRGKKYLELQIVNRYISHWLWLCFSQNHADAPCLWQTPSMKQPRQLAPVSEHLTTVPPTPL